MSFYKYHVFFCTNDRQDGSQCCQQHNARAMRDYLKKRTKELGMTGENGVRINLAGCMDRCADGPVAVVYPEAVWYSYIDEEDMEEILEQHLQGGRPVERLMVK
ncbi:MAG: (2Fe-2S) ferredoxin domain-containing protein [Gammaproteobacteria bacterium]|nr:MAG: (2Fe-2S) ferredoxin domain-containing protein [Gammaproteobacteria bacterium]